MPPLLEAMLRSTSALVKVSEAAKDVVTVAVGGAQGGGC